MKPKWMNIIKEDSLSLLHWQVSRAAVSPFLSGDSLSFCFCLRFRTCRGKCGVWPSWTCLRAWSCSRPWTLRSGQSRASRTSWTKSRPTTFPQNGMTAELFKKQLKTTFAKRQLTYHCVWSISKLQEVGSKNQELLAEIERLKKETEELRLRRGEHACCGWVGAVHWNRWRLSHCRRVMQQSDARGS